MLFPSAAWAQSGGDSSQGGALFQLLFLAGIFILFYLLLIRPQRKRQKEHDAMVAALEKGDEVVTGGGFLGRIARVDGEYVLLRLADNVEVRMQSSSVHAVLPKGTLKNL